VQAVLLVLDGGDFLLRDGTAADRILGRRREPPRLAAHRRAGVPGLLEISSEAGYIAAKYLR
jgi:hypothetical protein